MSGAVTPILEIHELAPTQIDKVPAMNDAFVALEAAFNAQLTVSMASGDTTLSFTQFTRNQVFLCTGATAARKLIIPLQTLTGHLPAYRVFLVSNASGAYSLQVGGATGTAVTLPASSAAMLESDGTNVTQYAAGGVGPVGGAISILQAFNASTSNADPGNGQIALNNATQNAATAIYMDLLDYNGTDWTSVIDTLDSSSSTVDGQIRLFNSNNTGQWIVFNMTARVSHTGYRELSVVPIGASATNPFAPGTVLTFAFTRAGDSGAPILPAVNTWTKRQHTPLVTLTDAATIAIDFSLGNQYTLLLGGSRTMGNPSNVSAGDNGNIAIQQDGTG